MSRKVPPVEVNNYAMLFTKPIFKNQNGEWYRDVGYIDSIDLIRENFQGAAKSFIAIGYYLKHIKNNELYKEGNYQDIWECAQGEFGLSQSAASRYMSMNDAFSMNGDTPMLDEKYSEFSKSQLQEMLAIPEVRREEIKPEQTVNEIREIVREEKRKREPSEKEIRNFYDFCMKDIMDMEPRSTLKDRLKERYRNAGGGNNSFDYEGTARGLSINRAEEITWGQLVKLLNQYIPQQSEKEEKRGNNGCPPGADSCIRQEWGFTSEQQADGEKECKKCWNDWKKKEGGIKRAEQENTEEREENINEQTEEQIPGQMEIEDYPEYLPDAEARQTEATVIDGEYHEIEVQKPKTKIEKLYELLERAEREKDAEAQGALRWAIFSLE